MLAAVVLVLLFVALFVFAVGAARRHDDLAGIVDSSETTHVGTGIVLLFLLFFLLLFVSS